MRLELILMGPDMPHHRIARRYTKAPDRITRQGIPRALIEPQGRKGAFQLEILESGTETSPLEICEKRLAHAAETRIGIHIEQCEISAQAQKAKTENSAFALSHRSNVAFRSNPTFEIGWRLILEPIGKRRLVSPVIVDAQLDDRPAYDFARDGRIRRFGWPNRTRHRLAPNASHRRPASICRNPNSR